MPPAPSSWKRLRAMGLALGLIALALAGLGMRRFVYAHQASGAGVTPPFTMESALQFRYIRMLFTGESLPALDREIEYPEGIRTFANDSVSSEYIYAALCRWFPSIVVLSDRVRWLQVIGFALGIPCLTVWIRRRTRSWAAAWAAGALYAVNLGSVIRSTGLEISHENFALPLWFAHLMLLAPPVSREESARARAIRVWGAGLLLMLALMSWDMIQLYAVVWIAGRMGAFLRKPRGWNASDGWWIETGPCLIALAVAGAVHPYLRSHGFLTSPAMALGWGLAIGGLGTSCGVSGRSARTIAVAVAALTLASGATYFESYGHFGDLLWAKILHLNRKPLDPALLNFNQRIMWTPALHSADWRIALTLFPFLGPLAVVSSSVLIIGAMRGRPAARSALPWVGAAVLSWIGFVLFVRFSVFAAVFSAAVCGAAVGWAWTSRRLWARAIATTLVVAVALLEWEHVRRGVAHWGPADMYYPELTALGEFLRSEAAPEPVLANFHTSGFILAYGRCPVILHPKFESPGIRRRVEEYGRQLFLGTESAFRDWAEARGARYYVHGLGEFSSDNVLYQTRYMVNALDPPDHAVARKFEYAPERLRLFALVYQNRKYRVFRVVHHADEIAADRLAADAAYMLSENRAPEAEALAARALRHHPLHPAARTVLSEAALRRAESGAPEIVP
ncbi:MAG: hypothetical protein KBA51_04530 [Kiritimatiellae bacterium]|nr:hypothetical protein [Kiritimatiellia bacterium]